MVLFSTFYPSLDSKKKINKKSISLTSEIFIEAFYLSSGEGGGLYLPRILQSFMFSSYLHQFGHDLLAIYRSYVN